MNRIFLDAAIASFRRFASAYGGQYDLRDPNSLLIRFSHSVVGKALVRCSLTTPLPYPSWGFAWWEDDFDKGHRRAMAGFRRSSGNPSEVDAELAILMCEIMAFEPSRLVDVGIAYNWRQRMLPERFVEMRAHEALCYPAVDWKKLLAAVGSHFPGKEWEFICATPT